MKDLFKKTDIIVNPFSGNGEKGRIELIEVPTIYPVINDTLSNPNFLSITPIDELDLMIRLDNLCIIFKERAKFLFQNSIKIAYANLDNLVIDMIDNRHDLYIAKDKYVFIQEIENSMPYLFDLLFYVNEDLMNYSSIPTIIFAITSMFYNTIKVHGYVDMKDKYTQNLYNNINKIIGALSDSLLNDIQILYNEARVVFQARGATIPELVGQKVQHVKELIDQKVQHDKELVDQKVQHDKELVNDKPAEQRIDMQEIANELLSVRDMPIKRY